jgi:hypothetical protein
VSHQRARISDWHSNREKKYTTKTTKTTDKERSSARPLFVAAKKVHRKHIGALYVVNFSCDLITWNVNTQK